MKPAVSQDSPLDGSNIERTRSDPPTFWTQDEINGNTYIIHFRPPVKDLTYRKKIFVKIWATPDGSEERMPKDPNGLGNSLKNDPHELISAQVIDGGKFKRRYNSFEELFNEVLNEAICYLEEKQEAEQKYANAAIAVMEANKEVHEGINYQLEQENSK